MVMIMQFPPERSSFIIFGQAGCYSKGLYYWKHIDKTLIYIHAYACVYMAVYIGGSTHGSAMHIYYVHYKKHFIVWYEKYEKI